MAGQFSEGLAAVGRDGKWGFIDKTGKIALPFAWDYASGFLAGRARVEQKKRWGFVDRNGIPLGPIEWDRATDFSDGLALAWHGDRAYLIDNAGKAVLATVQINKGRFGVSLGGVSENMLVVHLYYTQTERYPDQSNWIFVELEK